MKNQIEIVRYLASRELQDRYIVHGTKDEYLLPDELVESALNFVEDIAAGLRGSGLSDVQREVIQEFGDVLRANGDVVYSEISNAELVERSPQWASIREAAQRAVNALERD